ncbi:hypothetical protein BD289DRAFT_277313 [Coniella lustricola]|uniref:DUF2306 domain-containing protein n=1 Tax=Coniella lustricola TaxID=2025994 RepID=A0A2T3A6H6_9PEZI|nr:hypothetical protein BD289DRAFT_277313 [Coniella lustricola]
MYPKSDSSSRGIRLRVAPGQQIYRLIGFQKGYNLALWCIFGGSALAFGLGRAEYLDYYRVFCRRNYLSRGHHAAPGECYYFLNGGLEQIGMMLHLYSIIPCCCLVFFQFIPALRQRCLRLHRVNGYASILCMGIALLGGLMSLPGSFGGDVTWMTVATIHSGMVATGLTVAMIHVRNMQIEQHRAWMLRTWIWAFCIITMRAIQMLIVRIVSDDRHIVLRPCAQIMSDGVVPISTIVQKWPDCTQYFSGNNPQQEVLVTASYLGLPIEVNAALSVASGTSASIALLLHILGAEIYVRILPCIILTFPSLEL